MILRSFLCLLLTALFVSAVFAAPPQGYTDVQSLQYEFGHDARKTPEQPPALPCPCANTVAYVPMARPYCYPPVCVPCYTPCYAPCYSPCSPAIYRRACVRPVYHSPHFCW